MNSRKMTPVAAVIILLLSLLWILVFYPKKTLFPSNEVPRRDDSATAVRAEAPKEVEKPAREKSEAQKQIERMRERTDFLGNSAAILMTEDVQLGMVNKAVTQLEQAYQPLFSKWGMNDANRRVVLDIVRAREARLISIRVAAQKDGIDAMAKSKTLIESERAGYAHEISELLGPEKMRELAQLDKTVQEKAIADLRARIKK